MRTVVPVVVFAVALFAASASAQVRIAGAISGVVIDSSDLVVPGATVQLKDEGTGITKQTTTNRSGLFSSPDLNFGSDSVQVSLQGFQTTVFTNVIVESSGTTDLRVKLTAGQITETVLGGGVL